MTIIPTYESWLENVRKLTTQEIFYEILAEERDPTWPSISQQLRIKALHEVFAERMKEAGIDWVI
jgi:hypothetical protein